MIHEKKIEARRRGDEFEERQLSVCPCCLAPIPNCAKLSVKLCIKWAEQGCSASQFWLGNDYKDGEGVNVDMHKAAYWYHRSTAQGHTMVHCAIGRFHFEGLGGCDKSYPTAEKFYASATAKMTHVHNLTLLKG